MSDTDRPEDADAESNSSDAEADDTSATSDDATPGVLVEAQRRAESPARTEDDDRDIAAAVRAMMPSEYGPPMRADDALAKLNEGKPIKGVEVERLPCKRRTFAKPIEFANCKLTRASLNRCTFEERVVFNNCLLTHPHFDGSTFKKGVRFSGCELRYATFRKLKVEGAFRLVNSTVEGAIRIENCKFDVVDTWETDFKEWVDFKGCTFESNADFRSADFESGFSFARCKFRQSALFRGTAVAKKLEFRDCLFEGLADFSKAKLRDFTYLTDIKLGEKARFAFMNTIAQALLIPPSHVDGRLQAEHDGDLTRAAAEYGVLKNNYQRLNWLDEEDWAYYRFKRTQRQARAKEKSGGPFGKLGRGLEWAIFDVACAYGTKPSRVLLTALFTIVLFALLYLPALLAHPTYDTRSVDEIDAAGMVSYRITGQPIVDGVLTAGVDSTAAFVSGFDGVDKNVEGWPALLLTMESLAGMLLLGLFIVSFSRKVIR